MRLTRRELDELIQIASQILNQASNPFRDGQCSQLAINKGGGDFATEVDSFLEKHISSALITHSGIGVHGEEHGGTPLDSPLFWVLDPIDGTFNYAAGSPMTGILLGLVDHGHPVAGLTWLPLTNQYYYGITGGPLVINGVPVSPLAPTSIIHSLLGMSSFHPEQHRPVSGRYCMAVFERLIRLDARLRMHGATGVDLAYVASGVMAGAISFGDRLWDHAAGVALIEAAGGIVSDLVGQPWTIRSHGMLAGAPYAHHQLLDLLAQIPYSLEVNH